MHDSSLSYREYEQRSHSNKRLGSSPTPNILARSIPTAFYLFQFLSNAMHGVLLNANAELRAWMDNFFKSKPSDFCRRNITNLENILFIGST